MVVQRYKGTKCPGLFTLKLLKWQILLHVFYHTHTKNALSKKPINHLNMPKNLFAKNLKADIGKKKGQMKLNLLGLPIIIFADNLQNVC